jgi:hypothetical protein
VGIGIIEHERNHCPDIANAIVFLNQTAHLRHIVSLNTIPAMKRRKPAAASHQENRPQKHRRAVAQSGAGRHFIGV